MSSYSHLKVEHKNSVATVWVDHQDRSVNVLTVELVDELTKVFQELRGLKSLTGVIIASAKPKQFIAGADVEEIFKITDAVEATEKGRIGQELMASIENLPCPTVAVIDGPALGGGLELALACTYRIAGDGDHVKLGLPETQLGIIPGWGGTQRLPKIIGLAPALDMILSGTRPNASRAYKTGLVDDIAPTPILQAVALKWLKKGLDSTLRSRRPWILNSLEKLPFIRKLLFYVTRKKVIAQTKGFYPAPLGALEVIEETYAKDHPMAYEVEARKLGELLSTSVCKSLVGIFLSTEEVKRKKFAAAPTSVQNVGIVGAGVMGGGIAHLVISQDKNARMKDVSPAAVQKGVQVVYDLLEQDRKKRKQPPRFTYQRWTKLAPALGNEGFEKMDVIIEAVVEDLKIKKQVFHDLASVTPSTTILASNTSGLSISRIAEGISFPERVLGFHFFNPVHKMPLVEIIKGDKTSEAALATAYKLALDLGKTPIIVKDSPGFLVNRILGLYMGEALRIAQEKTPVQSIERAIKDFGMPMGPFELFDEVGLDVSSKVGKHLCENFPHFPNTSTLLDRMISRGRLGKKNRLGFYIHQNKKKKLDLEFLSALQLTTREEQIQLPNLEARIAERLTFLMINEASRCLEEKVIQNARDVDLGMILGTGFAPFRGGLLKYANSQGLRRVYDKLLEFSERHGSHYRPTNYLHELAKSDGNFV